MIFSGIVDKPLPVCYKMLLEKSKLDAEKLNVFM